MLQGKASNSKELLRVYNGLTRVQLERTFSKKLGIAERRTHLKHAFELNGLALRMTHQPPADMPDVEAQVRLRRGVLLGREAELDARDVNSEPQTTLDKRAAAVAEIRQALQDLGRADRSDLNQDFEEWGRAWLERLHSQ